MASIKHVLIVDYDGSLYERMENGKARRLITQTRASEILNVTKTRIGQLLRTGKLDFVAFEGIRFVYLDSVMDRIASERVFEKFKSK